MKNSTILHEVTPDQITGMFTELKQQICDLNEKYEPKNPTEYLTRSEVAKLLKCDLSTVHNWMKKKKLIAYGIGNRVYFKRSEVEESIQPLNKGKEANHG